jgi:hypothetical protein
MSSGIGLTPEAGGRSSRPNHGLTSVVISAWPPERAHVGLLESLRHTIGTRSSPSVSSFTMSRNKTATKTKAELAEISRRNGAKSRGPRSAFGRER